MRHEPEEIESEEYEEVVRRAAAVDVAKDSGTVCIRVPDESNPERRRTTVLEVEARTAEILELADYLVEQRIERVVMESTSDYWRPFFYLLEGRGLKVWLVNSKQVKQVERRPKTDKLDAVWLCKLNEWGMLRPSFVPPVEIRQLRDYTRLRTDLIRERSRHMQRTEKLLEDALIKLSSVATDIFGVSGRAIMDALISGQRDPQVLAEMAKGQLRNKRAELAGALRGRFDEHHAELLRILLDQVDTLSEKIEVLTGRIEALIQAMPAAQAPPSDPSHPGPPGDPERAPLSAVERLDEITGMGVIAAQTIIAELGLDMAQFPSAAHLMSWAKVSPRTIQSGAKRRAEGPGKGNSYLKGVLGEAAMSASKTKTFLGERYRRIAKRRGKLKALVATMRSILGIVWHLLADPYAHFHDLGANYFTEQLNHRRKTRHLVAQLEALGHQVTLTQAPAA